MSKSIVPQSRNPQQLSFIPEEPRIIIIDGEPHVAIYDAYRINGKSNNPRRDWKRDKAELVKQGYDVSKLVRHNFGDNRNGQSTPVASREQIARIAQVAKFPAWEPLRQQMAELLVADRRGEKKPVPLKQTKEYRAMLDSGYTPQQAIQRVSIRDHGVGNRHIVTSVWARRGGNVGKLTDLVTERATGKPSWKWKRQWNIKVSPRNFFSSALLMAIGLIEGMAAAISEGSNSQGQEALKHDINKVSSYIDMAGIQRDYPGLFIKRPLPKPEQRKLLKDGEL